MQGESAILREIRLALNSAVNDNGDLRCRVRRVSVGYDEGHRLRYGTPGEPDLQGVLRGGRAFGVEVKTERGRLSDRQRAWWRSAAGWGWTGGVARSVADAIRLLDAAERGEPPDVE